MAVIRDLGSHFPIYRSSTLARETDFWKIITYPVAIIAATAGTGDVVGGFVAPHRMIVTGVTLMDVDGGVTANATDYATVVVTNKGAAAGETTVVATRATDTVTDDDVTQYVPWEVTLSTTQADLIIERGEAVIVSITKANSGVAVGQSIVSINTKAIE